LVGWSWLIYSDVDDTAVAVVTELISSDLRLTGRLFIKHRPVMNERKSRQLLIIFTVS
jgi:hypothetical protein